jgi:hypothetical protein
MPPGGNAGGPSQPMNRFLAIVASTVVVSVMGWTPIAEAQPGDLRAAADGPARQLAFAPSGSIEGIVADDRGVPLAGVLVSAVGVTSAVAVTDQHGVFTIRALPAGAYMVRAHLAGFVASPRQFVEVRGTSPSRYAITLQRAAPTGKALPRGATPATLKTPPPPPKVLAAGLAPVDAGFDPLSLDPFGLGENAAKRPDDQGETAWRIRHLPRSVLKDTTERAANAPDKTGRPAGNQQPAANATGLARALGAPVRFLGDLPLTGQVNLVTSGSFDGGEGPSSSDSAIRGTAFFALGGPAWGYGDWSARLVTQATPGSWFVSGGFRNRGPSRNLYNIGFSYSSQRLVSATSLAHLSLDRPDPGDRSAGLLYGAGRFTVTPRLLIDYGGRYARYDYLKGAGLVSPSLVVTLVPVDRFRIRVGASQRQMAPGAEEFLEPFAPGLWVPPERTFVDYSPMVPERTTQFDVAAEHDLTPGLSLALRAYYQNTTDQQVLLFGDAMANQPGHYGVADAGDVIARGWSIGVTHHLLSRLRGSVTYELTEATWFRTAPGQELLVLGFGPRPRSEQLHGLATSVETDLPLTETHVYVAYRLNTGFTRRENDTVSEGFDSRFDVQLTQRLPFLDFTAAQWQVLLVVKNVFRDVARDSSVYDELLVVKPPTRILGGFVVRF